MEKPTKRPAMKGQGTRRRSYVRGAERRRQILETAAGLFSARGYTGTTTKQIATAVGISETMLFRHFASKEILYAAILEDQLPAAQVGEWLGELGELADRRDDEALFTAVAAAVLRSYRDDPRIHRLMLFAALEDHRLARRFHRTYTVPLARFLRGYVARRQADGAFGPGRPAAVVHALLSVPANFAQWRLLGSNPLGLTELDVIGHARTLLAGIRSGSTGAGVVAGSANRTARRAPAPGPRARATRAGRTKAAT